MSLTISETDARAIAACPSFRPSALGHLAADRLVFETARLGDPAPLTDTGTSTTDASR